MSRLPLLALFILLGVTSPALAQPSAQEQYVREIENRATMVINSTMEKAGERAEDFGKHLAHIFTLLPFEYMHLDSGNIRKNIIEITDFLQYLEDYREAGRPVTQTLMDSITSIRAELPQKSRKKFLVSFEKAYTKDVNAFDGYIVAVTKLFKRVIATLEYLSRTQFKISKAKTIEFSTDADEARFKELMAGVQAANKDVSIATEASKKATAEANTVMQDVYGKNSR